MRCSNNGICGFSSASLSRQSRPQLWTRLGRRLSHLPSGDITASLNGSVGLIAQLGAALPSAGRHHTPCFPPQFFINGLKTFRSFDDIESSTEPNDLLGVEVYSREVRIPSVYSLPINQPRSLVSIWTRA